MNGLLRQATTIAMILMTASIAWAATPAPLPLADTPTAPPMPLAIEAIPAPAPVVVQSDPIVYYVEGDGLDEVNAKRIRRGLRPFMRDPGLVAAAMGAARFRASYRLFGHTSNDFAFVPAGTSASSAGCAAYPADYGWMSCDVYDSYDRAGAYWVLGSDNRRYMHLFVGHGAPAMMDGYPVAGVTTASCATGTCTTSTSGVVFQAAAPPPVVVVKSAPPPPVNVQTTTTTSVKTSTRIGAAAGIGIRAAVAERFSKPFMERRGPVRSLLSLGCR